MRTPSERRNLFEELLLWRPHDDRTNALEKDLLEALEF